MAVTVSSNGRGGTRSERSIVCSQIPHETGAVASFSWLTR